MAQKIETLGMMALSLVLMGQWVFLRGFGAEVPVLVALASGASIFGAAFALSWAAEAAQKDIPASLSVAFIALLAVLPEYAVDIYFAWQAGQDPTYTQYATANMTGANRLLIGAGWPMVVFAYWWKSKRTVVELKKGENTEMFFLLAATVYSFSIPLTGTIGPFDSAVLLILFIAYIATIARSAVVEPELEGPAELIGALPTAGRRLVVFGLFAFAGVAIFLAAEPFAEALLETGRHAGIDEFILVQWLAPLASETPEFVVAILFALRLKPNIGFAALLSSKVNQWTLLISMLPLAFSVSAGTLGAMQLDERQSHEVLLTSAQSLFALIVVIDLRFGIFEALALLGLFAVQLAWPDPAVRMAFVWIYLGGAVAMFVLRPTVRERLIALVTHWPGKRG